MAQLRPYIFLDFDGVISLYKEKWDRMSGRYIMTRDWGDAKFRGRRMQGFLELIDARLIISSNWRYGSNRKGATKKELASTMKHYLGIAYPIHGMTPLGTYSDYGDVDRGQLIMGHVRKLRIKAPWLCFDDTPLEGVPLRHKVITDDTEGVTEDDFNLAIHRLDSQL